MNMLPSFESYADHTVLAFDTPQCSALLFTIRFLTLCGPVLLLPHYEIANPRHEDPVLVLTPLHRSQGPAGPDRHRRAGLRDDAGLAPSIREIYNATVTAFAAAAGS